MTGKCKQCGRCCEVIQLPFSLEDFRSGKLRPEFPYDAEFVLKYWVQIDPLVAWHISPDRTLLKNRYYYRCLQYDQTKKLCRAQKFKPPVCENYPWYGREPDYLDFPECGFQEDLRR